MNKFRTALISLVLIFAVSTSAFANGLSLNSVGPKALGMGGAFVGLANDGTAIYWNPAGLAGQESSVMGYFTGIMPMA
ncbi:MAG: long chain fatty acid transport protein, partial [Bacteroidota bacterium]